MKRIMLAVFVFFCSCALANPPDTTQAATTAANKWLGELDNGRYGASWNDAAPLFQARVSEQKWVNIIANVRDQLGTVVSRRLASATATDHVPNSPPGRYVVLQFDTAFANKSDVVETVTPMLSHGKWRVAGYFIH